MAIERYCTEKDCPGGEGCINKWRDWTRQCTMEYVASPPNSPGAQFNWLGDDPPPSRWMVGNTMVYRTFADSCD
jgi:hypothetical protein